MEILLVIAALAAIGYSFYRKKKRGWHILYSAGVPNPRGSGLQFDFPNAPGHVNYVQWFKKHNLRVGGSITARFNITGGGYVRVDPETEPLPTLGLIIQRKGAKGRMDERWFSDMAHTLEAGEFTVTVPLDVSAWGDVMGGREPAAFAAALKDVESVGFVFGAAGGRGHGVYAQEPSRFSLLSLEAR